MSTQSESDAINAAAKFNEAVEATAVVGGLVEKVDNIDARTERIETKLDRVVSTVDHWGGAVMVVSTLVSIATGIAVWIGGTFIVHLLGFK